MRTGLKECESKNGIKILGLGEKFRERKCRSKCVEDQREGWKNGIGELEMWRKSLFFSKFGNSEEEKNTVCWAIERIGENEVDKKQPNFVWRMGFGKCYYGDESNQISRTENEK